MAHVISSSHVEVAGALRAERTLILGSTVVGGKASVALQASLRINALEELGCLRVRPPVGLFRCDVIAAQAHAVGLTRLALLRSLSRRHKVRADGAD